MIKDKECYRKIMPTLGMLPTSYLVSMTYEEQLLWLLNFLNKTILPQLEKNIADIEELQNIKEDFDKEVAKIENAIEQLDNFRSEINEEIQTELNTQYDNVLRLMNNYQTIFNNELQNTKEELENRIEQIELGDIMAYDPTTGKYENVSTAIQNVYDALRTGGITAGVFDDLELTCTAFDGYNMTAQDFDMRANEILL